MKPDRSNVILQGVVGSTAYGLATENSDIDQLGIYVAPIGYVLGLNGSEHVVDGAQNVADSLVEHEPDLTLHEVGKYVRLALSANPTILELLWLPEYEITSPSGRLLVEHRHLFLSGPKVKARYGGYAKAQAERLLRNHLDTGSATFSSDVRNRTAKHGRHCRRLLMQGAELLMTGSMSVKVDEIQRQVIFEAGERAADNPQQFRDEMIRSIKLFDAIDTDLPDKPNQDEIDDLLVAIRLYEGTDDLIAYGL